MTIYFLSSLSRCAPGYSKSANTDGRDCEPTGRVYPDRKEFVPEAEGQLSSFSSGQGRNFAPYYHQHTHYRHPSAHSWRQQGRRRRYRVRGRFYHRQ